MRKQPPRQRKPNDLSHGLAALDSDHTLIAVVELSLSSWLVAGVVPGVERQPLASPSRTWLSRLDGRRSDFDEIPRGPPDNAK